MLVKNIELKNYLLCLIKVFRVGLYFYVGKSLPTDRRWLLGWKLPTVVLGDDQEKTEHKNWNRPFLQIGYPTVKT